MIKLNDFKLVNLSVNWGTLMIGWEGPGHFQTQLSISEIQKFAEEWLSITDKNNDIVSDLIINDGSDFITLKENLEFLWKQSKSDLLLEQQKWRYVLLKKLIEKIAKSNDYMQGLIELTDFWAMFDFPEDSPHVVQGRGNKMSPVDYYTEETFKREIKEHQEWLNKELVKLQKLQLVKKQEGVDLDI